MHMTNGHPEPAIKARRNYSKSQKLDFHWSDYDEKRAEHQVRSLTICCRSNELTVYKSALYKEIGSCDNAGKLNPTVFPFY